MYAILSNDEKSIIDNMVYQNKSDAEMNVNYNPAHLIEVKLVTSEEMIEPDVKFSSRVRVDKLTIQKGIGNIKVTETYNIL